MTPMDPAIDMSPAQMAGIYIGCSHCKAIVAWVPGIMPYAHDTALVESLQRIIILHVNAVPDHPRGTP